MKKHLLLLLFSLTFLLGSAQRDATPETPTATPSAKPEQPAPGGRRLPLPATPVQAKSLTPEQMEAQREQIAKVMILRDSLRRTYETAEAAKAKTLPGYDTVAKDPFKTRIYTLQNGLRVYLSVNKEAPRIQTMFAIKAGSKFDPAQTTGLAHYLEHMMFKGTHDFGTKNWARESTLLDSISAYYEYHKAEKNEMKKKALYAVIDSLSYEASKFAIPNEYDKMVTSLGAQGTNAFTSTDMTVYVNDIPSNALEKFLELENNRFRTLVLRLFHTELETVYEEFNRNQDNDRVWSDHAIDNALLPHHPYGTQTTIGEGEHLKNPSLLNIHSYFDTYYRPNNAALILCGDLDPDSTFKMIEKVFGSWRAARIPRFVKQQAPEIKEPVIREYKGPQPEHVYIGYRFDGASSREAIMARMMDMILANGAAGLIDLDLVQSQKVLQAYSFIDENTDYVLHKLYAEPKQQQKLEEVKDLLLGEIEKVKKGDFGDWVLPAIVQNMKLERMKATEKNDSRAYTLMNAFVHDVPWSAWVEEINTMERITKEDIVAFANKYYTTNYAVCYKRQGEANVHKVEKPKITAVVMNKEDISPYKEKWEKLRQPALKPKFVDFNKDIAHLKLAKGDITFDYVVNTLNNTFTLQYIFDMGTDNIRNLGLAVSYLEYLGTDKYTAEALKTEFYKLGLSFGVSSGRDRVTVSLTGLEDNLDKGITLFEHVLANAKADKEVYENMVADIMQQRKNAKKNKNAILYNGLGNYAKYGPLNPFNNVLSEKELQSADPEKLTDLIHSLSTYKHKIYYYGSRPASAIQKTLNDMHKVPVPLKDYPAAKKYPELPITENSVFVCYYPMKQAEIVLQARGEKFNKDLFPYIYLYNDYYGSGLSSIMFQEIREKMALAYSVYSSFGVPQYADESHYVTSYVGTQADKMKTALAEMNKLLNDMPQVNQQYEGARASVVKTLESDWTSNSDVYGVYDRALKRGLNYDIRKDVYEKAKSISLSDLNNFFNAQVKGKKFNYLVIGKKEDLNMDVLKSLGTVKEVTPEELFGF